MSEGHCSVAKGKSGFQRAQPPGPPHAQHRAATTPLARPLPSAPAMPAIVAFIARSNHGLRTGEFQVWAAPLLRVGQARSLRVRVAKGQGAPTPAVHAPRPPSWPALPAPSWPRIPDRNAPPTQATAAPDEGQRGGCPLAANTQNKTLADSGVQVRGLTSAPGGQELLSLRALLHRPRTASAPWQLPGGEDIPCGGKYESTNSGVTKSVPLLKNERTNHV